MKERYFDLMECALRAYSTEHIQRYFADVRRDGLTEHGFPRLTANIGILLSHGRCPELRSIFLEMMDFCCRSIPNRKAANDFSVREIICCLDELERHGTVNAETLSRWKDDLRKIRPQDTYNKYATSPTEDVRNWALFTGVSEFFRQDAGLCDSSEFIDLQIASQLQFLDEFEMYMDHKGYDNHQPIVYDIVPRGLFAILLDRGYRGKYYRGLDDLLKKTGLLTLAMQSCNGEIAFGGRSNQFLHNEAWLAVLFEYEAKRYAREGNRELVSVYKSAIDRALSVTVDWLSKTPVCHIKNRYPTETKHGCERYAYFDKYMITLASFLYAAYSICDDTIEYETVVDESSLAWQTSPHFHKLFLKAGGYALEFDTDADPAYDAIGLGRVHRVGAPSAICMSLPCPSQPNYVVSLNAPRALSLCPAILQDGVWKDGADGESICEVLSYATEAAGATASLRDRFSQQSVRSDYSVDRDGVRIAVAGEGMIGYTLPAFCFDGAQETEILPEQSTLSIRYEGWCCRYNVEGGFIEDSGEIAENRNGRYRVFRAVGERSLHIRISIFPC